MKKSKGSDVIFSSLLRYFHEFLEKKEFISVSGLTFPWCSPDMYIFNLYFDIWSVLISDRQTRQFGLIFKLVSGFWIVFSLKDHNSAKLIITSPYT